MKVFVDKDNSKKQLDYTGTVGGLLKKLGISKETVIVARKVEGGFELLTEDDKITDKDSINILSVVSGG